MYKVENLDLRICDVEADAKNDQTYREFIREAEDTFGLKSANLEELTDEQLTTYIEHLDYLWTK